MATYRKIKDLSVFEPKEKKTKKWIWAAIALVLLVAVFFSAFAITNSWIFKSKKTITVEITHSDGYVETIEISSRKDNLLEVLKDEDLVDVQEGPDGITISAAGRVGKEIANWETMHQCWQVLVNGEEVKGDLARLLVQNGATYKIVLTSS